MFSSLRRVLGLSPRQPDGRAYRVFTRQFDQVVEADRLDSAIGHLSAAQQTAHEDAWQAFTGALQGWRTDLHLRALAATERLRKSEPSILADTAVTILVDQSGSMKGQSMLLAAASCDVAQNFLSQLGIEVEVLGFTTVRWKGGRARERWLREGRPRRPGRLCDLLHIIYRPASDTRSSTGSSNFKAMLRPDLPKENVDGEALEWARSRLAQTSAAHRILLVISDGAPVDDSTLQENDAWYLERHLQMVISQISSDPSFRLLSVGIGWDVGRYYPNARVVAKPSDLGAEVIDFLEATLAPDGGPQSAGSSSPGDAANNRAIPPEFLMALGELNTQLNAGHVTPNVLASALQHLAQLPPQSIAWADARIAYAAGLFHQSWRSTATSTAKRSDVRLLEANHDLAPIMIFHRDGYVREAALKLMDRPASSPFAVAALAWRLNDWADPVRAAALPCFERVLAKTSPAIIVSAAPFLLDRWRVWKRWSSRHATAVDLIFQQPNVVIGLVEDFRTKTSGPLARTLRYALRSAAYDSALPVLLTEAVEPNVRAVALQTLIEGVASWPEDFGREWVDKTYGLSRRITLFGRRPLSCPPSDPVGLIQDGLRDRSAMVRRVAADALIMRRDSFPAVDDAIARLRADQSSSIRERGEWLARWRGQKG